MNEKNLIQKAFRSPMDGVFSGYRRRIQEGSAPGQPAEKGPQAQLWNPMKRISRGRLPFLFFRFRTRKEGENPTRGGRLTGGWIGKGSKGMLLVAGVLLFTHGPSRGQGAASHFKKANPMGSPEWLYFQQLLWPEDSSAASLDQVAIPPGIRYFQSPDSLQAWQRRGRAAFLARCRQLDHFLTAALPEQTTHVASRWQEADQAYRHFLDEHPGDPRLAVFRQYGAYQLLIHSALPKDSSAEATAALVFYMQELLKARSQNVILFYYGTVVLKGRYPDIRRFQLARQMIRQLKSKRVQERMINSLAGFGGSCSLTGRMRRQLARWKNSQTKLLAFVKGVQCGCSAGQ